MSAQSPFVSLLGLAVPFDIAVRFQGRFESFRRVAFDKFLDGGRPVYLNFDAHDQPALCRNIELFAGIDGLFFRASLPAAAWDRIDACVGTSHQFCSIGGMVAAETRRAQMESGQFCREYIEAAIDHVCLCDRSAVYGEETATWLSPRHRKKPLTARLARMEARWVEAKKGADFVASIRAGMRHRAA